MINSKWEENSLAGHLFESKIMNRCKDMLLLLLKYNLLDTKIKNNMANKIRKVSDPM